MATCKKALITGITGQDGAYLSQYLLGLGYDVYGLAPRRSTPSTWRLEYLGIADRVHLIYGDLTDQSSCLGAVAASEPDEVYNLGSQSFVGTSWDQPVLTANATGIGALNMLEAVRRIRPSAHFYQASSSELFGGVDSRPLDESSPFYPKSPYGVAKMFAHWTTINYRTSYGLFCCCGIAFNHESPLRGIEFVTRKVSNAVARIKLGLDTSVSLGNMSPRRDWGFSGDYVKAMHALLQQDTPSEYIIATGKSYSVQDMCRIAFSHVGLDYHDFVRIDERLYRPSEVDTLTGNPSRIRERIGWTATTGIEALIGSMVDADIARNEKYA